jgi:hypothetical protein
VVGDAGNDQSGLSRHAPKDGNGGSNPTRGSPNLRIRLNGDRCTDPGACAQFIDSAKFTGSRTKPGTGVLTPGQSTGSSHQNGARLAGVAPMASIVRAS